MTSKFGLLKDAAVSWWNGEPFRIAAALAFYTVFSLSPLLVIAVAAAGLVFDRESARSRVADELGGLVGPQGGEAVAEVARQAELAGGGPLALTVGLLTLLTGSTVVFAELQSALNQIWGVKADPAKAGLWPIVRSRLLSFGLVLAVAFLLVVSLGASAALSALEEELDRRLPGVSWAWRVSGLVSSLALVTALFTLVYRFLPDARIPWRDAAAGGLVTSVLFNLGKHAIGAYLGRAGIAGAYGQAGSFVVLLVWVYYSALICLYGAEITRAITVARDARVRPDGHAAPRAEGPLGEEGRAG